MLLTRFACIPCTLVVTEQAIPQANYGTVLYVHVRLKISYFQRKIQSSSFFNPVKRFSTALSSFVRIRPIITMISYSLCIVVVVVVVCQKKKKSLIDHCPWCV